MLGLFALATGAVMVLAQVRLAMAAGWLAPAVVFAVIAAVAIGFLTNDYVLGTAVGFAGVLAHWILMSAGAPLWLSIIGANSIPCLVGLYFAKRFVTNMGD